MKRRVALALLSLCLSVAISSCGDRTTTGPTPAVDPIQASVTEGFHQRKHHHHRAHNPNLVRCRPQKPDLDVRRIGPRGGKVEVGPYTLTIPDGALKRPVFISGRIRGGQSINVVEFQPDGLVFDKPASLSMSYSNCEVEDDEAVDLQIAVVDDSYQILYYLSATAVDLRRVIGQVEHFTNYAVAW